MKINIKPQPNSSIVEEIKDLELGNYTIFAGENNAGKSNLARAIENHEDLKDYKKIFIPAEHTQPQNEETKTSAAKFEFYKLIKSILDPIFNKNVLKDLIKEFNNSKDKEIFVGDVNKILKDFGVEKKEFDVKILDDEFEEDFIIKSLVKAFVKDLYETEIKEVDLENIGMGTQRLIVAALIKYYVENKIKKDNEKVLIIFEEPELYLHPKWKNGLHKALLEFCKGENSKVLITTHDPYFIELGKKQKIYHIYRNPAKKDATDIEEIKKGPLLPYKSDSEINYQIFDIPSKSYFLEIYDYSKHKAGYDFPKNYVEFDKHMFDAYFQAKGVKQNCKDDNGMLIMPITRLRHDIAHGKGTVATLIDLKEATEDVISFLNQIK